MNVEAQLLASDLRDSMVPESGLPRNVSQIDKGRIAAQQSVLCQIMAITDIGNSAFSLQNVRQTRIDQADLAGLAEQAEEEDGEDYVIPKYPRSMLRFILCDGSVNIHAFECRRLPGLELGVTPLGCKVRGHIFPPVIHYAHMVMFLDATQKHACEERTSILGTSDSHRPSRFSSGRTGGQSRC
jgi:hypothetical protein